MTTKQREQVFDHEFCYEHTDDGINYVKKLRTNIDQTEKLKKFVFEIMHGIEKGKVKPEFDTQMENIKDCWFLGLRSCEGWIKQNIVFVSTIFFIVVFFSIIYLFIYIYQKW